MTLDPKVAKNLEMETFAGTGRARAEPEHALRLE